MMERLTIRYIPLEEATLFEENSKKHDIQSIVLSVEQNGFRNPPLWDKNLNHGEGGIVAGNGRTEALMWMKAQGRSLPKGLAIDESGQWCLPVVFGCDADSEVAAKRFSIDDNNLTLAGGEFSPLDMSRMWDANYLDLLKQLSQENELPITVDEDDLNLLLQVLEETNEEPDLEKGSSGAGYQITVFCESFEQMDSLYEYLLNEGFQCKKSDNI